MYWKYARETQFYERLLKRVVKANESEIPAGVLRPKHERASRGGQPDSQDCRSANANRFPSP